MSAVSLILESTAKRNTRRDSLRNHLAEDTYMRPVPQRHRRLFFFVEIGAPVQPRNRCGSAMRGLPHGSRTERGALSLLDSQLQLALQVFCVTKSCARAHHEDLDHQYPVAAAGTRTTKIAHDITQTRRRPRRPPGTPGLAVRDPTQSTRPWATCQTPDCS